MREHVRRLFVEDVKSVGAVLIKVSGDVDGDWVVNVFIVCVCDILEIGMLCCEDRRNEMSRGEEDEVLVVEKC